MTGEQAIIPAGGMLTRVAPNDDFNRYTQEMEKLIDQFELSLMGLERERDKDGNPILVQRRKAKVNEEGKNAIIMFLKGYLNPNTYMSMIEGADTKNNYRTDVWDLMYMLCVKHQEFALSLDDFPMIHSELCRISFMALKKAETDKKYIYEATKTNYQPAPEQKQGGIFGRLL